VTPVGNGDQMQVIEADRGTSGASVGLLEVAMVDLKGTKAATDGTKVTTENVIGAAMEDLSEKNRGEVEHEQQHELEEEMAERRRKKLACFQKAHSGVVKKGDTAKASTSVNSPFSKYGADMEGITPALTDSVHGSVESLKLEFKQESEKMPRQVRAIVQQVLDESRDKREMGSTSTGNIVHGPDVMATLGSPMGAGPPAALLPDSGLRPWLTCLPICILCQAVGHACCHRGGLYRDVRQCEGPGH
jgi:hypothetical protein